MPAQSPSWLLQTRGAEHSDDSPFVSAADFFSLISLTLIYALIAVVEPGARSVGSAQEVQVAAITNLAARDPYVAYVTVSSVDTDLLVTVAPSRTDKRAAWKVASNPLAIQETKARVLRTIREGELPSQVVFYMSEEEENPEAHKLFNQLLAAVRREHPVIQAFRSAESP